MPDTPANSRDDLARTLDALDDATQHFVRQDPALLKALFSRADDVTIAGGLGGIEQGWEAVGSRLDRVSSQYTPARYSTDRIALHHCGDLAVLVQLERFDFEATTEHEAAVREYRATIALRQEAGQWRVVHRHADGLVENGLAR